MGVADQADAVRLGVEAQLRLERREHVLPDRIPGARVEQADVLVEVGGLELVRYSRVSGVITPWVHLAASAAPRENSSSGSAPRTPRSWLPGQADRGVPPGQLDARVGLGAVADEVAQAPHLLALGGLDRVQHRLEGMPVAMDVRDDCDSHLTWRLGGERGYSLAGEAPFAPPVR